jgi:hypothetical protein
MHELDNGLDLGGENRLSAVLRYKGSRATSVKIIYNDSRH